MLIFAPISSDPLTFGFCYGRHRYFEHRKKFVRHGSSSISSRRFCVVHVVQMLRRWDNRKPVDDWTANAHFTSQKCGDQVGVVLNWGAFNCYRGLDFYAARNALPTPSAVYLSKLLVVLNDSLSLVVVLFFAFKAYVAVLLVRQGHKVSYITVWQMPSGLGRTWGRGSACRRLVGYSRERGSSKSPRSQTQ